MVRRFFCLTLPLRLCAVALIVAAATASAPADTAPAPRSGMASYYSDRFQGLLTASGVPFDQQAMTAAHRKLPMGTRVRVTRPATDQSVEVVINDRGPYAQGRIIDLSRRAAQKLDMLERGVARVIVTVID